MTRCVFLQIDRQSRLAPVIRDGLAAQGVDVTLLDLRATNDLRGYDFALMYGPMQTMTPMIERLKRLEYVPPVAIWYTEQCPPPHWHLGLTRALARGRYALEVAAARRGHRLAGRAGRLRALGELLELQRTGLLRRVAVFTETHRAYLRRFGLPARTVPIGHHFSFGKPFGLARDIDVVFLGTTVGRRRRAIIAKLEAELSRRGVSVDIRDGSPQRGYCFDDARTILLNRAKILLNIMRQPWDDPVHRMLLAASNGAMLLSEPLEPDSVGPFKVGEHLATADIAELGEAVSYYASNPAERERIARQAFEFVTREMSVGRMCAMLLDSLGA